MGIFLTFYSEKLCRAPSNKHHPPPRSMNTVYAGNLHEQVTPSIVHELFTQVAPVKTVHLPRDRVLQRHMGYGFVELMNSGDVEYAIKMLQGTKLFDQSLRLNKVNNEEHSVFVRNLDSLVDQEALKQVFSQFGDINEIKLGQGNATVSYKTHDAVDRALKVSGTTIMNNKVIVERKK